MQGEGTEKDKGGVTCRRQVHGTGVGLGGGDARTGGHEAGAWRSEAGGRCSTRWKVQSQLQGASVGGM